jgi:hypothetical protein
MVNREAVGNSLSQFGVIPENGLWLGGVPCASADDTRQARAVRHKPPMSMKDNMLHLNEFLMAARHWLTLGKDEKTIDGF